jgi:hypothetical protein
MRRKDGVKASFLFPQTAVVENRPLSAQVLPQPKFVEFPGSGSHRVKYRDNQVQGEPRQRSISLPGVVPPVRIHQQQRRHRAGGRFHAALLPDCLHKRRKPPSQSTDPTGIWFQSAKCSVERDIGLLWNCIALYSDVIQRNVSKSDLNHSTAVI